MPRAAWFRQVHAQHGFGFFAAELRDTRRFIGFIGLTVPSWTPPFRWEHPGPCIEIGWRLDRGVWGQGLATEGARACIAFAFQELRAPEVIAITVPGNVASQRVMEKLGMVRSRDEDFAHPRLPHGHPLSRHVLYRILAGATCGARPGDGAH
jgi:RimJ/RimL family protein N-acetyltransferase